MKVNSDQRQENGASDLSDDVAVQDAQHRVPSQLISVQAGEFHGAAERVDSGISRKSASTNHQQGAFFGNTTRV